MPACHAGGHEFESRTHRFSSFVIATKNGALVQLVRMPACHAGGHEFESRTHRISLQDFLEGFFGMLGMSLFGSNNIVVFLTIQYYCLSLRHE